jgi:hypothetical protein
MKRYIVTYVATMLLGGCDNGFDPPSLVLGPRILAIAVEPPEAAPGRDVVFRPFLAHGERLELEWTVSLSTAALANAAGQVDLGTASEPIALAWDGERATLDGAHTEEAMRALDEILGEAALGTREGVVRAVYERVGLALETRVFARDENGEIAIEAFKRFVLAPEGAPRTSNPPPPRFAIGDRWVSGRGGLDPFVCAAEDGGAIAIAAGAEITIAPDENDAEWLETFPSLDLAGQIVEGEEDAYYSFFVTGGEIGTETTRPPARDTVWTAPADAGDHTLYVVVRDGHLGTSACVSNVRVE